jgi:hypothetical protein
VILCTDGVDLAGGVRFKTMAQSPILSKHQTARPQLSAQERVPPLGGARKHWGKEHWIPLTHARLAHARSYPRDYSLCPSSRAGAIARRGASAGYWSFVLGVDWWHAAGIMWTLAGALMAGLLTTCAALNLTASDQTLLDSSQQLLVQGDVDLPWGVSIAIKNNVTINGTLVGAPCSCLFSLAYVTARQSKGI